jgi:hypothetical protein
MKKIFLFETVRDSNNLMRIPPPNWWLKFLRESQLEYASIDQINQRLVGYSASFVVENDYIDPLIYGSRFLCFETKEDMTLFFLRWS